MLIRLVSHGDKNAEHIDKMIAIDGLPDEWIFDRRRDVDDKGNPDERLFLRDPWKMDVTENIPYDIRGKFQPEPWVFWFETPHEPRPGVTQSVDMPFIRWMRKCHGLVLNYQTNQGQQMWAQIVDLLDRETPRTQRIPEPRIVGTRQMWTLSADQVPYVKLTGSQAEVPVQQIVKVEEKVMPRPNEYPCRTCGDIFDRERGRWMHERRKHAVKDPFIPERKAVAV